MISAEDREIVEALIAECRDCVVRGGRGDRLVKDEKSAQALCRLLEENDQLTTECDRLAVELESASESDEFHGSCRFAT